MKIVEITSVLVEGLFITGNEIKAVKVKEGIPLGCKLCHAEYREDKLKLFFAEPPEKAEVVTVTLETDDTP